MWWRRGDRGRMHSARWCAIVLYENRFGRSARRRAELYSDEATVEICRVQCRLQSRQDMRRRGIDIFEQPSRSTRTDAAGLRVGGQLWRRLSRREVISSSGRSSRVIMSPEQQRRDSRRVAGCATAWRKVGGWAASGWWPSLNSSRRGVQVAPDAGRTTCAKERAGYRATPRWCCQVLDGGRWQRRECSVAGWQQVQE